LGVLEGQVRHYLQSHARRRRNHPGRFQWHRWLRFSCATYTGYRWDTARGGPSRWLQGGTHPYTFTCGTAYALFAGLRPFIKTVPTGGTAGQTGATFTVESPTLIEAIIPPGTATGFVTVIGPSGTLTSLTKFSVQPS
jgi:hypothetical protein